MIMRETTKLLHDIQKQVVRLNEIETYENVPRPMQSNHQQQLSEFEQATGWIFNNGSFVRQQDLQEGQRLSSRPPIPPPMRLSSLPRGASASTPSYHQPQLMLPPPPPALLVPPELH